MILPRDRLLAAFLVFASLAALPGCVESGRGGPLRIAFLAGGSGEPEADNFFVEDLRALRLRLRARGWNVSAAVGRRGGLLPGSAPATNANLLSGAVRALSRAGSGDQVLLLFHSHGKEREKYWGQRSHSIVSEDLTDSGADAGFDLDTLEAPIVAARGRGVEVALIDLSCYSGATQVLNGPACTVTLAGADYISLCSGRPDEKLFTSHFLALPAPGQTIDLESQFLAARRKDRHSVNLPQISSRETPARLEWERLLETVDPLDAFGEIRELRTTVPPYAPEPFFRAVGEALARAGKSGRLTASASGALLRELRTGLNETLRTRNEVEKAMPALARDYDSDRLELQVEGRAPMSLAVADLHSLIQALRTPEARLAPGTHAQKTLAAALLDEREAIERRHKARLASFTTRRGKFDALVDRLEDQASSLMSKERDLYDFASEPYPGSDGCRNFQL